MAQSTTLKAEHREHLGTRAARTLRTTGRIPANLQSEGEKPHLDFSLDGRDFLASRRHHVHLYDLDFGGAVESAVVRELQWDAFGDNIIHIEFKRVTRGVETESEVELEFVGNPKAGLVNHLMTHITIRSIPSKIPDAIEVRVSDLPEGAHVRAGELELPEGVSLAIPPETELLVISSARAHLVEEEPAEVGEPGEVEIIGESKPEGEAEEDEG